MPRMLRHLKFYLKTSTEALNVKKKRKEKEKKEKKRKLQSAQP